MSYVDSNLLPNERVLALARLHWWIYTRGAVLLFLGVVCCVLPTAATAKYVGAFVFLLLGTLSLLQAWILAATTELAVTNKRVIAKVGLIRRNTVELLHNKVESLNVHQGIMARILDFGTVTVTGTGSTSMPIPSIAAPLEFRKQSLMAIESSTSGIASPR